MVVLGEKLDGESVDWLVGMLRIVLGALFLRSSRVRPTLLGQCERLPRTRTVLRKHKWCRWTGAESVHVVCIRFSLVGCTSIRIAATLGYE
jgi:hypothetical protein